MMVVTITTGACLDVGGEIDLLVRGGVNRLRTSRLSAGGKTVLLTLGARGAVAFSSEHGLCVCRSPDVVALHTVGCGDSFLAGFLQGTLRGLSFSVCLRLASATGAAAAISHSVASVDQSVVDDLLEQTVVEQIS